MKTIKKILCVIMVAAMVVAVMPDTVNAATKVKLNKKKVTLTITDKKQKPTTTLKVKGVSKKVAKKAKWSTSNKKVATVKKGKVTAKKAGKATITCKVKGKKYTCKVTVVDKRTADNGTLNVTISKKASDTGLGPKLPKHINAEIREQFYNSGMILDDPVPGGEEPYALNKIMVTYNGKDVTNKAKYEISESQVACVVSPGVIKASTKGLLFNLTVSYKGEKTTVRMRKTTVNGSFIICYCGAVIENVGVDVKDNPYDKHASQYHHGGCWVCPYLKYIDIKIK